MTNDNIENENESYNPVKELVESKMTTSFKISGCPMKVFNEFKQFAIEEAGDNYSLAIKILLDYVKSDVKTIMLLEEIENLKGQIININQEIEKLKEKPSPKKQKYFGDIREDEEK